MKGFLTSAVFLVSLLWLQVHAENVRFERISLTEGLSQESILTGFQDSEGFMWFGTQEGLNRFDGYQFSVYANNAEQSNSLSSDWIYDIDETHYGLLLIGTRNGLNTFNKTTQTFKNYRFDVNDSTSIADNNVRVVFTDSHGAIWLGTERGLNQFLLPTEAFRHYPSLRGVKAESNNIFAITEDIAGGLWIGTDDGQIYRVDAETGKVTITPQEFMAKTGLSHNKIRSLLIDSQQRLWIGTYGEGVSVVNLSLEQNSQSSIKQPAELAHMAVIDLFETKDGKVWLATDDGLYFWDDKNDNFDIIKHDPKNPYSLSGNKVTMIFQDKGGVLWVGTYSGLNKWNVATAKFAHYFANQNNDGEGLSNNYINTFWDAGQGLIWIGSYEGGLNLFDPATKRTKLYSQTGEVNALKSDKIMALYSRSDNEIWIGYRNKGLSRLDRITGQFTHYEHNAADPFSIGANGVTSFAAAENGDFWVGTFNGGLNYYDASEDRFVRYLHNPNNPESLSSNRILSITKDAEGKLWLGTWDGGLNIFDPQTMKSVRIIQNEKNKKSLTSNAVWTVVEDVQKNIWVGTQGGGLNLLSSENRAQHNWQFKHFDRAHGLPSNVVYGILIDNNNHLWLSTNRGITKFNPEDFSLLNYDSSHGLQGNEFNSGAFYKARDGLFYFGGTNGVTAFNADDILPNAHVPPVVLTRFQRLNEIESIEAIKHQQAIEISYKDYLIAFEFAGLDYASPPNNHYAYMLEGFDRNWVKARDIRKATYTNLPAGNYVFRVKASNNDGVWNEEGTKIALTVHSAPWFSWWAYTLYTILLLLVVLAIFRSYRRKLNQQQIYQSQLEHEVEKRTEELQVANQQLLNASVTDQLTGLHNRRYLADVIEQQSSAVLRQFERANKEKNTSATVGPRLFFLMFDLDGFKPVNDTYGHDAGDQVIIQSGELLKKVSRTADVVIRWGGDEFLVVGQVQDLEEVEVLAERIRQAICDNAFDIGIRQDLHLSSSIGYSCYPFTPERPDEIKWQQVHNIADSALYLSKRAGRNCWTGIIAKSTPLIDEDYSLIKDQIAVAIDKNVVQVKYNNKAMESHNDQRS